MVKFPHLSGLWRRMRGMACAPVPSCAECCAPAAPALLFLAAARALAGRLGGERSASTCDNYATALRSFARFLGGEDVAVEALGATLIGQYCSWLEERGVGANTQSCYLRSLRVLYRAVAAGQEPDPFCRAFTGASPTRKRSAPADDVRRVEQCPLPPHGALALARDVFLFSFYAQGMPFADVARLRVSQVSADEIVYRRHKTGHAVCVAIEQPLREIVDRWTGLGSGGRVFPLVGDGSERAYASALRLYNRRLLRLSRLAGVRQPLTSYVARHTWASMAYAQAAPLGVIAEGLGHASTRATMTYVRTPGTAAVRQVNQKIIESIKKSTS